MPGRLLLCLLPLLCCFISICASINLACTQARFCWFWRMAGRLRRSVRCGIVEGEDIRREVSESSSSDVEEEKEEERSGCCEVGGGVDFVVVVDGGDDVEGEVVVRSSEEEDMLSLEVCWGGGRESIVWSID
jgi:hypothetical protein